MHHTYFAFTQPFDIIYPMEIADDKVDENQKQFELNMTRLREDFMEMSRKEVYELVNENKELAMLIYRQREARRETIVSQAVCWTTVGFYPKC